MPKNSLNIAKIGMTCADSGQRAIFRSRRKSHLTNTYLIGNQAMIALPES